MFCFWVAIFTYQVQLCRPFTLMKWTNKTWIDEYAWSLILFSIRNAPFWDTLVVNKTQHFPPFSSKMTIFVSLWHHICLPNCLFGSKNRSTEGCSKLKSPETRQVHERLVSTLEHLQVPKWDRTRCPRSWHAAPVAIVLWKLLAIR